MTKVDTTAPKRVAIILVNWNGWRDSVECIDTILACAYADFHIYLVDNDSSDQSIERIIDWCAKPYCNPDSHVFAGVNHFSDAGLPVNYRLLENAREQLPIASANCRLTLIRSGANLGFAGGNNVGIRLAWPEQYDYFWLLNSDTVIETDTLMHLVARAQQDSAIGIVGSTLLYYTAPTQVQAMGGAIFDADRMVAGHVGINLPLADVPASPAAIEAEMAYVVGASMLVSRSFIEQIGLMQEDYFLYFEELDWAMRAQGKFRMGYAPQSRVYHKVGASSADTASWFSMRLLYRNRLKFVSRFFPARVSAAIRYLFREMCWLALTGRFTHARAIASALRDRRELISAGAEPPEASLTLYG
jgi:GT2 family glycosyltransferase